MPNEVFELFCYCCAKHTHRSRTVINNFSWDGGRIADPYRQTGDLKFGSFKMKPKNGEPCTIKCADALNFVHSTNDVGFAEKLN